MISLGERKLRQKERFSPQIKPRSLLDFRVRSQLPYSVAVWTEALALFL